MQSADLLLTLVTGAEALRQFLSSPEADEHGRIDDPERLRLSLPSRYRRDLQPGVPERPEVNQQSVLLLCRLILAVDQVWEHRQLYRLATAPLLHQDLAHLTNNLSSLAHSGSRLEATVGLPAFAALTASLTLSASALSVLYSRIAYKRFDDWRSYFLTTSLGASGLAFAMKMVDDQNKSGFLNIVQLAHIPEKFSCWPELLLAQMMLPQKNVSFAGHLCGIFAGLLHVFLPKAVKQLHQARKHQQDQRCKQQQQQQQSWLHRILADDSTTQPSSRVYQEGASWSDLRVHALCAVVSLGGHQLLRILQKRLRRRGDHVHRHGGRSSSRQQRSFVGTPRFASSASEPPSRGRRSSNTGRFL